MKTRQELIETYPISWSQTKIKAFRKALLNWYDQMGRSLPWRENQDPYSIWVSEIMLQQTQVKTVIPYYQRFMTTLPNVAALAKASEEQILSLWQGLGYYSRVRNMQTAAQEIVTNFDGQFPQTKAELLTLKGIGDYTAAAIASMAFGQVEPALDGNLIRIVTRLFEIDHDVTKAKTKQELLGILYQLIDPDRPGDFNQAMMDLGATVMTPDNLNINASPLKEFDLSYQHGTAKNYPNKPKKKKSKSQHFLAYYISNEKGQWLMRQHQEGELLQGLWHYPMVEADLVIEAASQDELSQPFIEKYHVLEGQADRLNLAVRGHVKHVFSHRIWQVDVLEGTWPKDLPLGDHLEWVDLDHLSDHPHSSLQEKMYQYNFDLGEE